MMAGKKNITNVALLFPLLLWLAACQKSEKMTNEIIAEPRAEVIQSEPVLVKISWETSLPAAGKVDYGLIVDNLDSTVVDTEERQHHEIQLTGLEGERTYYFRVTSYSSWDIETITSEVDSFQTPADAGSLVRHGWEFFQAEAYDSARARFQEALQRRGEYPPAYIGLGWIALRMDSLDVAQFWFDSGLFRDDNLIDGHAGRAVVFFIQRNYSGSLQDVDAVLQADSNYIFQGDTSFTAADLHLLAAQDDYALGQYDAALDHCTVLFPDNGLDPAVPTTWQVNGTTYSTFPEAVLALIRYLMGLYG